MTMTIVSPVDGVVVQYDPDGLWKMWALPEIYMGKEGKGKYVGKVNDYVVDPETFETWRISALDTTTLVPTLVSIKPKGLTFAIDEEDVLFGVDASMTGETWLAYLNTTVSPHTLTVDQRLHIDGQLASYAKIFKGLDTTAATGIVISKMYDSSGNFVSTKIPLELCALDKKTNYAVKAVRRCYITEELKDGDIVTVVIYADDSQVVSKRQMKTLNTNTIADVNDGLKYITSVDLESIWMSGTSTDQIDYPLNIPMDALNLVGVVTYSDGTVFREAVGVNKFSMYGLDGRISSIPSQPHDLVLNYRLSGNETSIGPKVVNGKIVKPYTLMTTNPNNSIAVKLFGYPFWVNDVSGYQMRWFLMNLARNVNFEVTNYVSYAEASGPFDPTKYGYLQRKTVSVNLRDISGTFIPFVHTQVVDIVLNSPASNEVKDDWSVGTESTESSPNFGLGVYGTKKGNQVNFAAGFTTQEDWLTAYYLRTRPLYNADDETAAPLPTHFIVSYNGQNTEWTIDQWDKDLSIGTSISAKTTAVIRFIRRTASGDLQLSYAAALIKSIT